VLHGKKLRRSVIKPLWNLFHGEPNGKRFRLELESNLKKFQDSGGTVRDIILSSMNCISDEILDSKETVAKEIERKSIRPSKQDLI
jgi:hypothetical protein